jgi:hypothetical protein
MHSRLLVAWARRGHSGRSGWGPKGESRGRDETHSHSVQAKLSIILALPYFVQIILSLPSLILLIGFPPQRPLIVVYTGVPFPGWPLILG